MRDENETEGRSESAAKASDGPDLKAPETGEKVVVLPDQPARQAGTRPAGPDHYGGQGFAGAQLPAMGTLPEDTLDEIPGFLRRCATETSAQEAPAAVPADVSPRSGDEPPTAPASTTGRGAGFAAGPRGEAAPVSGQISGQDGSEPTDWSNTARGALSELLADIDDEQARRVSNRDQFAALAEKRRTTWPLTALIVSFLLVVLAYSVSVRNVDAGSVPGAIWRQAWALVTGPDVDSRRDPGPRIVESETPVAALPARKSEVQPPQARPPEIQPTVQKKATGLIFEPVKIVEPLGRGNPVHRQTASVKPAPLTPPAAEALPAPLAPPVRATVAAPANPVAIVARAPAAVPVAPSTTIALAPSIPAAPDRIPGSPDKMPLASLAISETAYAPSRDAVAAPQLRRVASVAPDAIGATAERQADTLPARAGVPTFNLASRTPPSAARPAPVPSGLAVQDSDSTKAMLSRAETLLEARDLASARLLFERAVRYGSAAGAFGAARTYDPVRFEKMGVRGVPAEPQKAVLLYQKAIDAGHAEAAVYLGRLNTWLKTSQGRASTAQR